MLNNVSRRSFLKAIGFGGASAAALATAAPTAALADNTASTDASLYRFEGEYGCDIMSQDKLQELENDCAEQGAYEVANGLVLLRNENGALPLAAGSKVTLLGQNSIESTIEEEASGGFGGPAKKSGPFYSYHSGGDSTKGALISTVTYLEAMKGVYEVNQTLVDAYQTSGYKRVKSTDEPEVGEAPSSFYTDEIKASWASDYNDAAIVMLTRQGSEDCDLLLKDPTGVSFMALHQEEKDLLSMVKEQKEAGVFKRVVVLINSSWAIEIGDLPDYGVDAVLWVGAPGATGFKGVAQVLTGEVNPSGHLVDTFAKNSLSAPAITYAQENTPTWKNLDAVLEGCKDTDKFVSYYLVYAENIYVGYKYYETRYEDSVLGQGNAASVAGSSTGSAWSYTDEIAYPFGYGLSYTDFEQKLDGVTFDSASDAYKVSVTVTNKGTVAGRSVVQVYAQTPYGDYEKTNKVEKSAVQLVGFGKTAELQAGASETVEVEVEKYLLASYDYTKAKSYILSAGDYYLAVGDDSHDALNNILAAKGASGMVDVLGKAAEGDKDKVYTWNEASLDATTYAKSRYSDTTVTNQFDDCDINTLGCETVTYLSRSDWDATFPVEQVAITATADMISDLDGYTYEVPADAPAVSDFTQGVDAGLTFADMYGVDYDDDGTWDSFLNQLTVEEMASIMPDNNGSIALDNIAMPASYRGDDMDQLEQVHFKLTDQSGFLWPSIMLSAATFDREEIARRAALTANEAFFMGCNEIWTGGPNIHRTPFNGRATAYYSEDGQVGYFVAKIQSEECQKRGIIFGLKHFCLNDQEAHRESAATFCNEQAIREQYMRAFEGAYAKGGCQGMMTAFNRMGTTYCGHCKELLTNVLREEWGAHVTVCSDAVVGSDYKKHYSEDIAAGMTYWCWDTAGFGAASEGASNLSKDVIPQMIEAGDGYMLKLLRQATKDHVYCEVNSIMVNGLAAGATIEHITPWWENALTGAKVGSGILAAGFLGLYLAKGYVWDKDGEGVQADAQSQKGGE
ncbi:glycoside hydrolase family 3 protein [Paratractidigestivibacter sp.]|uniref:glycoside hydrolase family 3 protein n=1 Tax=Paratractidigestivibacter sp. TaxID=2847316 RepID=UPI002AC8E1C3|nr:glycoside hydrolase family 3 C-terminal domain-containing protein [Paratractidigestivibacter sp.]